MKRFLKWLTAPDVLPLVARLALVALTALVAEPPLAAAVGAAGEAVGQALRPSGS